MDEMKVQPWGEGQGDHVRINVADFDPAFHVPLNEEEADKVADKLEQEEGKDGKPSKGLTVPQLKEALDAKKIAYTPDAKKADLVALLDATDTK